MKIKFVKKHKMIDYKLVTFVLFGLLAFLNGKKKLAIQEDANSKI